MIPLLHEENIRQAKAGEVYCDTSLRDFLVLGWFNGRLFILPDTAWADWFDWAIPGLGRYRVGALRPGDVVQGFHLRDQVIPWR